VVKRISVDAERLRDILERLRAYAETAPSSEELDQIRMELTKIYAFGGVNVLLKNQRAARAVRSSVSTEALLESRAEWIGVHGTARGWLKFATHRFDLDRKTIATRLKRNGA